MHELKKGDSVRSKLNGMTGVYVGRCGDAYLIHFLEDGAGAKPKMFDRRDFEVTPNA